MTNRSESINSVERTLNIVEFLRDRERASISKISSELGYAMSTTHRYLKTLVDRGYLVEGDSGYRLSRQFLELEQFAQNWRPEYKLAETKINELATETNESRQITERRGAFSSNPSNTLFGACAVRSSSACRGTRSRPVHLISSALDT